MGQGIDEYSILVAYQAFQRTGTIELDRPIRTGEDELVGDSFEFQEIESPEHRAIKMDAWARLSREAQMIIKIIFQAPAEIADCLLTDKYKLVSKRRIEAYLLSIGWKKRTIQKTFDELKELVSNF